MMRRILFFGFLLWFMPFALSAQRTVSGNITDDESGEPVYGASVFISGTTVGTSTDTLGNYQLFLPDYEGKLQMAVSHVGYRSVSRDVETRQASQTNNVVSSAV